MTRRTFDAKIVTMVKQVTNVMTKDSTVITEGYLISLGKDRDRWSVTLPQRAIQLLGKKTRYEVTLKPLGSIGPVRVMA